MEEKEWGSGLRSRAAVALAALGEIERERFAGPRVRWGVGCGWK